MAKGWNKIKRPRWNVTEKTSYFLVATFDGGEYWASNNEELFVRLNLTKQLRRYGTSLETFARSVRMKWVTGLTLTDKGKELLGF